MSILQFLSDLYCRSINLLELWRKKYKIKQRKVHALYENTNVTYEGAGVFSPDLYSRLVISDFLEQKLILET